MTIVGDLGQASGPWAPASWGDVVAHLPAHRPPRQAELTVSYRTPTEVMDIAAGVLAVAAPELSPSRSVRRAGVDPVFTHVDAGRAASRRWWRRWRSSGPRSRTGRWR